MKKKILGFTFAVIFAIMAMGGTAAITTYCFQPSIEVVEAALSTTQVKTVQTKLKRWGY